MEAVHTEELFYLFKPCGMKLRIEIKIARLFAMPTSLVHALSYYLSAFLYPLRYLDHQVTRIAGFRYAPHYFLNASFRNDIATQKSSLPA